MKSYLGRASAGRAGVAFYILHVCEIDRDGK